MMQYPFTYQLKKDTDDISSTLQPLIDFTVVYVNIKSWSDRDDFISQVLRQMPSVQAPGLFVGFFKQFHIRVITPAGMDNYVELTMNEQAILRETEVVWRAVHYYWRSLLRSVSAAPVLSIPDLVWPEDFPQMDQRILRQFVSVHLQAVNEPLDKPEKELAVTTAIRYVGMATPRSRTRAAADLHIVRCRTSLCRGQQAWSCEWLFENCSKNCLMSQSESVPECIAH